MNLFTKLFTLIISGLVLFSCSDFFINRMINPDLDPVINSNSIVITGDYIVTGLSPLISFSISEGESGAAYELTVLAQSGEDSIHLSGFYPSTGILDFTNMDISSLPGGSIEILYRYMISGYGWSEWLTNKEIILDREVSDYYEQLDFDDFKGSNALSSALDSPLSLFTRDGSIELIWSSIPADAISQNGQIHAPPYGDPDLSVILRVQMTNGLSTLEKDFNLIIPYISYDQIVDIAPVGYADVSGSGVQNSVSDSDIQPELQAAIDQAESDSEDIFIPAGTYLIENGIVPFDGLSIAGSPAGLTIIESVTAAQIMNLSQGTTGTKDNLLFKDLVFINVNFQFSATSEFFDNVRFENCIFIMDDFSSYSSQLYCNDVSQLEFINCAILIQGPDASEQRGIYYYSSYNILLEDNIFGYDSSIVSEIESYGTTNMIAKLPKLQWLEDNGFFSGDMRSGSGDVLFRLFQDPSTYNINGNNKIYSNLFFASDDGDHIVSLRLTATEIGGNYFHRDTAGRSLSIADSRNIVISENYFRNGQVDIRSGYIGDLTDNVTDIFLFDNEFDGMGIFYRDSDDQPITVADVIVSDNLFIQGTEDISLSDTNPITGDYDLSAFTIDSANQYLGGGLVSINTGTLTGTLNTPANAVISSGNIIYYNPEEYANPVP